MAPKKSTIVLNVEQFIRDVEQRPAIWNRNFHCNKAFLEQMWDELSSEHKLPKVVLKAKWKGLRDNFRVEYKRIPRSEAGEFLVEPATFESKWIHYYALLFLTEHMRHRAPKNEQDQSFFFAQQTSSQDCEKTVVEPDLTNGLIGRLQDSDEEFDEDDIEEDDDDVVIANEMTATTTNGFGGMVAAAAAAVSSHSSTPPAAHSQPITTVSSSMPGALIKMEDARNLLLKSFEKEVQDLSKKTQDANKLLDLAATSSVLPPATSVVSSNACQQQQTITSSTTSNSCSVTSSLTEQLAQQQQVVSSAIAASLANNSAASSSSSVSSISSITSNNSSSTSVSSLTPNTPLSLLTAFQAAANTPPLAHSTALAVAATLASMNGAVSAGANISPTPLTPSSVGVLPGLVLPNTAAACIAAVQQHQQQQQQHQKIRSVSPPPLYNKAHHPSPLTTAMGQLCKERLSSDEYAMNATANCLHAGSLEHLSFTKHSYTNGLIPALKLKRPRLSEDSNFNGSSTMDTTSTASPATTPLVPEDDDYHYLLSLHPYMKQLTAAQKLRIRTKIQKLIFKELYKEDLEESK